MAYKSRYSGGEIDTAISKAQTALQKHQDISHLATKIEVEDKQDNIADLDKIREGAYKGATALQEHQPLKTINGESIIGEGNIVIEGGSGDSGLNEEQLAEYLENNQYAKKTDIPTLDGYATTDQLGDKQDKLVDGENVKTINGESILGKGDIAIGSSAAENKKKLSILFVGNSLTQDGIAYLPYMLKNYYPEVDFHIYMWYIGGATLATHYDNFTSGGNAEIFSIAENEESWTNYNKSKTMSSILSAYSFDIVCMQEYFNYKTEYTAPTDWNLCRDYILANYKGGNALEFISLFHAPLRKEDADADVDKVFERTREGNALILQQTISEDVIPNGIAVYRALDTDLNSLGDKGQLSPDGTHTQEGLPCLLQTYTTLCWLFDRLGINKSVYGHPMRMTTAIYNSINVPGANLGSGVVQGTDAQNILAQEVAIKAYKEGKMFLANNLSSYGAAKPIMDVTFSITTNLSDATIKLNGIEQSSITILSGSMVNWEVSRDAYYTQSGSEVILADTIKHIELQPSKIIESISAVFEQGDATIFENQPIEDLRKYLVVTANYTDGSTGVINDYTLDGELSESNEIIVAVGEHTATFEPTITYITIPEEYTRYDYIEKKTTTQSKVTKDSFIYLKAYDDMNQLSMDVTLGKKPNITTLDGAGVMGSRPASGEGINYYAVYWNEFTQIWVGARNKKCTYAIPSDTEIAKIKVVNPAISPLTIKINNGEQQQYAWTSSTYLPYAMSLFNNVPNGSTQSFYVNRDTRISDIIFRKESGECVGYYVPVVYENKIGMYDLISKAFYTAEKESVVTLGNSACLYNIANWG